MLKLFLIILFSSSSTINFSQALAYSDPAQAYNKILLDKQNGSYQLVGTYKVKGTQYLYGGGLPATVFAKDGVIKNIQLNYDTYKQQLEVYFTNKVEPGLKKLNETDSFNVFVNTTDFKSELHFYSAQLFDSTQNFFLQSVFIGPKYQLYKRYKSELGYVSENIIQSELRQYELVYDYFYVTAGKKELKKIKLTAGGVTKEFKKIKDVSGIVEAGSFIFNPEEILTKIFQSINE